MSLFLPESGGQQKSGVAGITPSNPTTTDEDIALMERVFAAAAARPNAVPETFMAYILDFIQTNNLVIPIGQVFGFQKFLSTQVTAYVSTGSSSTSGTLAPAAVAVTAAGPTVTLGDAGKYIVVAGFNCFSDSMIGQLACDNSGPTVQGGTAGHFTEGVSVSRYVALSVATDAVVMSSTFTHGPNGTGSPKDYVSSAAYVIAIRYDNV